MIINPGSRISGREPQGWTNTHDQALIEANLWLGRMRREGFINIEMTDTGRENEGRWIFEFRHTITGVVVELETHGIDNLKAYEKQCIFTPRIYWKGGSTGEPELADFAAPGYLPTMTYRPAPMTDLQRCGQQMQRAAEAWAEAITEGMKPFTESINRWAEAQRRAQHR